MLIYGTELYRYQNKVDYKMMRDSGLRFAYVKATQGVGYVSPTFEQQYRGLTEEAGLDVGVLHFIDTHNYQIGKEIEFGRKQAEYHWSIIEKKHGNLPDCPDLETNEGASWAPLNAFTIPYALKIQLHYHLRMKELSGSFGIDYFLAWVAAHAKNFKEGGLFVPHYKSVKATKDSWVDGVLVKAGKSYQPSIDHLLTEEELATYPTPGCGVYDKPLIIQASSKLFGNLIGFSGFIDFDYVKDEATYALLKSKAIGAAPVISVPVIEDGPTIIIKKVIASPWLIVRAAPAQPSPRLGIKLNGTSVNLVEKIIDGQDIWWKLQEGGYVAEKFAGSTYLK